MKRRFLSVFTLTLFLCSLSASLAFSATQTITVPAKLEKSKIAVVDCAYMGGYDMVLTNAEMLRTTTLDKAIADLRSGKANAIFYDKNVLEYVAAQNTDLMVLEDSYLSTNGYVFAITPSKPELKRYVDGKIEELRANGQLDNMKSYWFSYTGITSKMPEILINFNDDHGAIMYATAANNEPFAFIGNDTNVIGYEIELLQYVAQSQNLQPFVNHYQPSQLLPAVEDGKADMAGGFMANDPRLDNVLTSIPYFGGGMGIMVLKKAP